MQKIGIGFGLALSCVLAAATPALPAARSVSMAQPVAAFGQPRSAAAREIGAVAPASGRIEVALLDISLPQARVAPHRRIKTHKFAARRHKERALQFSQKASGDFHTMIAEHATAAGVPFALADAVVRIESRYNPRATNGSAMGLMQIQPRTARGMGFTGAPSALLQPQINLLYGMKYLAAAFRDSHGDTCQTVTRYQSGHFSGHINRAYCAKAKAIMASR